MKIQIKAIRTDGGTQVRAELVQSQVDEYASQMREGDQFPPLDVFHDGSEYWLADGFHRYFAQKANAEMEVECTVHQGTIRDALWFAIAANNNRGLDLTYKERRANAEKLLRDDVWGKLSYSEIARHVGLSKMTLSRIAREILGEGEQSEVKTVKRKDGTEYKVNTSKNKRAKKAPVEKKDPESDDPPIESITEDDNLKAARDQIIDLEDEVNKLRDTIAVGQWDATEIEKIDIQETVEELRKQNKLLEVDNAALRDSRDMYQNRCSELLRQVKALQAKLKKAGIE
jgi:ParB-like chromosome segregation protein Spo0J